MRAIKRMWVAGFTVLVACVLSSHEGWAIGANQPDGDPPFGVAPQSDAKGTRVQGVFVLEFFNTDGQTALDGARGILRLRKGSQIEVYNASLPGPLDYAQGSEQQDVRDDLIDAMGQDIVDDFLVGGLACPVGLPGEDCLNIKVKRLEEFVGGDLLPRVEADGCLLVPAEAPAEPSCTLTTAEVGDQIFLMDIELAID